MCAKQREKKVKKAAKRTVDFIAKKREVGRLIANAIRYLQHHQENMSCTTTLTNVSVGCEALHLIPLASATQAMIESKIHESREMHDALTNA